jgi:hypothetical protein
VPRSVAGGALDTDEIAKRHDLPDLARWYAGTGKRTREGAGGALGITLSSTRPHDFVCRPCKALTWDFVAQAGQKLNPALRRYLRDWRLGELDDVRARVMVKVQEEAVTPAQDSGHLPDADRQAIIERYRAGESGEQLAKDYGVSLSTVRRLLRKAGVRRKDWPRRSG